MPEVKQAIDVQRHYGTYKYPKVAPPLEPNQAEEKAYIDKGLTDTRFCGVMLKGPTRLN